MDSAVWGPVCNLLDEGFRVAAMDRRGRGRSGRGEDPYSLDAEADDVLVVAEALGGDVVVAAHSIGATISLEALRRSRGLISAAVLYEPPLPDSVPPPPAGMIAALDEGRHEDALEIFLREMVRLDHADLDAARASPAWSHRVELIWTMRRETSALTHHDPDIERYLSIEQPVELLVGDHTARHHTEAIEALQATLRRAHTRVLPGQGHGALLHAPHLIAASINEHHNTR